MLSIGYAGLGLAVLLSLCAASFAMGKRRTAANKRAGHGDHFHRLFDEIAIAYHDIDTSGVIRRVNRAECDLLGYQPEELIGRPVWELVVPETLQVSREAVLAKLRRQTPLAPFQRDYVNRDGEQITLEIYENLLFDAAGSVIGIRSALLDVSARARAEAKLAESNRHFEEMANTVPVILWKSGRNGALEYINRQWLALTGQTPGQLLGNGWLDAVHPDDLQMMAKLPSVRAVAEGSLHVEYRLRRYDGQYRQIVATGVPRFSATGEFEGYIGSATDVTTLKQTGERLHLLESVVVNATEAVMITDADLEEPGPRILYVNESFTRMTGYSLDEVRGKSPRMLQGALTDKSQLTLLRSALNCVTPIQVELLNYRKDGTSFWNEMDVVPVADANGAFTHCVALQRDVTERKRIANDIQRYARELKEKNQALLSAVAAARESTELKSRFLANMSHEIRTPMNGIVGMIALLLTTRLTTEQHEYAEAVQLSASSLLVLINDILDLSRIEAGRLELDCLPYNWKTMAEEAVSLLALMARTKGLILSCDVSPEIPPAVLGDPVRIRQVITNLVGNAVKFTEQGEVRVAVKRVQQNSGLNSICVEVTDTGIGIPKTQCAQLFQRFSQTDNSSTRKHGGSGLGLAISRQLVELMGGEIGVRTEAGQGSTFWFTLPVRIAPRQPAPESQIVLASPAKPCDAHQIRILVAEDNAINQRIALRILEKMGFAAEAVSTGRLALEAVQRDHYDVVLMDVQMPEMDGLEATASIRKLQSASRAIPIIAMTANAMSGDRERCLSAGMDDYVSKPVSASLLQATLERWTKRTADSAQAPTFP
ncbi:MAG: PAS domain S-box protein [Bryobacteraceae bacterium]